MTAVSAAGGRVRSRDVAQRDDCLAVSVCPGFLSDAVGDLLCGPKPVQRSAKVSC